jgi:hypothetical protein
VAQETERTVYWATCPACLLNITVSPHPDRVEDADPQDWEWPERMTCPGCESSLGYEGADPLPYTLR